MTMTRKQFLRTLAGVGAGVVGASALVACGSDDKTAVDAPKAIDAPAAGNCNLNGTSVAISGNHGHALVVSKADVTAAADKMYDIAGTAAHTHTVMITAANFAALAANTSITVTSSTGGAHTHPVTVSCA